LHKQAVGDDICENPMFVDNLLSACGLAETPGKCGSLNFQIRRGCVAKRQQQCGGFSRTSHAADLEAPR
jgi:hypothetical protein